MGGRPKQAVAIDALIRGILAIAVVAAAVAGDAAAAPTELEWTLLAHLDGRGGLRDATAAYQTQLERAAVRFGYGLAVQTRLDDPRPGTLARYFLTPGKTRLAPLAGQASGPARVDLAGFVLSAARLMPARHYALLVMGHGAGLLAPSTKPVAVGGRPGELRRALEVACHDLGRPLDLLALDTCYGATLEVVYEFRHVCRFLSAAPGLIYSPGLDWSGALEDLAKNPTAETLVAGLVRRGIPGNHPHLALSGVRMAEAELLAGRVAGLAGEICRRLPAELDALIWARSRAPSWGERDELCDVGALTDNLGRAGATPEVRAAARDLGTAVEALVIARWASDGDRDEKQAGLGLYFPPTLEELPPDYRRDFEFASAAGWAALLEQYWGRTMEMLSGGGVLPK